MLPEDVCVTSLPPIPSNVYAVDDCSNTTLSVADSDLINCPTGGEYVIRTWVATDACGNSSVATQNIYLGNNEALELVITDGPLSGLAAGSEIEMEAVAGAAYGVTGLSAEQIRALNGCQDLVDVRIEVANTEEANCLEDGYLYRVLVNIWARDLCGKEGQLDYVLRIVDTTPPSVLSAPSITLGCTDTIPWLEVTDNSEGAISVEFEDLSERRVHCAEEDPMTRKWTLTDACGNSADFFQEVYFIDQEGPMLYGVPADACGLATELPSVIAIDACSSDTLEVIFEQFTEEGACGPVVVRNWSASDACGNISTATQRIYPEQTQLPTIEVVHPDLLELGQGQALSVNCFNLSWYLARFNTGSVVASNSCDLPLNIEFITNWEDGGDCSSSGYLERYNLVWTATDLCGNSSSYAVFLEVVDDYAPALIFAPADVNLYCGEPLPVVERVLPIDCALEDFSYAQTIVAQTEAYTHYTRTWTAVDQCGNTAEHVQNIFDRTNDLSCSIDLPAVGLCNAVGNLLTATVEVGTAPYTYHWEMIDCDGFITDGQGTASITYVTGYKTQNFLLTVRDVNGCETTCSISVPCIKLREEEEGSIGQEQQLQDGFSQIADDHKDRFDPSFDLRLFPNPASAFVAVQAPAFVGKRVAFEVLDMNGKIHQEAFLVEELSLQPIRIQLHNYPAGMYILRIKAAGMSVQTKRFAAFNTNE